MLLDFDRRAGLFQLALDRVSLVLGHALLDGLRGRIDEVLGLLQAEAGDCAHDLDHLDLLLAGTREDDVERRLLLHGGRAVAAGSGSDCDRSGGGDAPLLLDLVLQLDQLEDGHGPELLEDGVNSRHRHASWSSVGSWDSLAGSAGVSSAAASSAGASSACDDSSLPVPGAASAAAVAGGASAAGAASASPPPCACSCSIRASISP